MFLAQIARLSCSVVHYAFRRPLGLPGRRTAIAHLSVCLLDNCLVWSRTPCAPGGTHARAHGFSASKSQCVTQETSSPAHTMRTAR